VLLLHLSDVHVTDPGSAIARYASGEERLAAVVDHLVGAAVPLDGVVLTGDLVDHGSPDEYDRLAAQLRRLPCEWYALPGNHDQRPAFDEALLADRAWAPPPDGPCNYAVDLGVGPGGDLAGGPGDGGGVRLVMVDSSQPDHHDGRWPESTVAWLDDVLRAAPARRTVVFTHHPPVGVGLWHMDYGGGHGGDALATVVERHPQVEAVCCGHVHRRLVVRWAGTILVCAPSLTFLTEALLDESAEPVLHAGLPELPLYRFVGGRFVVDSLDWHPGRSPVPMPAVLGDGWDAYEAAARSGVLPREATGH